MTSGGGVFVDGESPVAAARWNQKVLLVDTGTHIAAATAYPGQLALSTDSTGGFTAGVLYQRNVGNTAWVPLNIPQTFRSTSDVSTSIGSKSSGVAIPLGPSLTYRFRALLYVSPNTGQIFFQIHALAAGASLVWVGQHYQTASGAAWFSEVVTAVTTNIGTNPANGSNQAWLEIVGLVTVGSTATTLQIDVVDGVTTDKVKAGSFIEVESVP